MEVSVRYQIFPLFLVMTSFIIVKLFRSWSAEGLEIKPEYLLQLTMVFTASTLIKIHLFCFIVNVLFYSIRFQLFYVKKLLFGLRTHNVAIQSQG